MNTGNQNKENMKIVNTISNVREVIKEWKKSGLTVGFVPTMGFLHAGHGSLIQAARENDRVVVSIFVNPMQFGPTEDLAAYPRDFEKDQRYCESLGTDLIFAPQPEEMYQEGFCTYTDMNILTKELCGVSRPVHFRGVCTVVNKLFNIVQADKAYFGQKDAQQVAIIKRMVLDLNIPTEIISCPIVREEDGLAKSSRNTYLNEQERKAALCLSQAVAIGKKMIEEGITSAINIQETMSAHILQEPLARIDYLKIVNGLTMEQIQEIKKPTLVAMAVYIGKTRLIDNFSVE